MKLSLDTIGYAAISPRRANSFPWKTPSAEPRSSAMTLPASTPIGPLGFPLDLDSNRRRRLKALYAELDLEMGAIVCCTSFLEANHVLLYPQEKEILYVRECIRLAKDLGASIVRILAGFYGYFQNSFAGQGYGLPSFESVRGGSRAARTGWKAWHQVQRGIREVALYAQDEGVTLALQTHPEITMNNEDTLELLAEIDVPSLKVGLDLPFDRIGGPAVRTPDGPADEGPDGLLPHDFLRKICTVGGAPAGWEEVTPGDELDPLPWEVFLKACQEIGYEGLLSAEQCFPHHPGHQLGTIKSRGRALRGVARFSERLVAETGRLHGP